MLSNFEAELLHLMCLLPEFRCDFCYEQFRRVE